MDKKLKKALDQIDNTTVKWHAHEIIRNWRLRALQMKQRLTGNVQPQTFYVSFGYRGGNERLYFQSCVENVAIGEGSWLQDSYRRRVVKIVVDVDEVQSTLIKDLPPFESNLRP